LRHAMEPRPATAGAQHRSASREALGLGRPDGHSLPRPAAQRTRAVVLTVAQGLQSGARRLSLRRRRKIAAVTSTIASNTRTRATMTATSTQSLPRSAPTLKPSRGQVSSGDRAEATEYRRDAPPRYSRERSRPHHVATRRRASREVGTGGSSSKSSDCMSGRDRTESLVRRRLGTVGMSEQWSPGHRGRIVRTA
jgi:hypothetical protein